MFSGLVKAVTKLFPSPAWKRGHNIKFAIHFKDTGLIILSGSREHGRRRDFTRGRMIGFRRSFFHSVAFVLYFPKLCFHDVLILLRYQELLSDRLRNFTWLGKNFS